MSSHYAVHLNLIYVHTHTHTYTHIGICQLYFNETEQKQKISLN